jgi:hypothetical protein
LERLTGRVWSGFIWPTEWTCGGLLWTRWWSFRFWCHGVSWLVS